MDNKKEIWGIVFTEIFLFVSLAFAISFLLNDNFVSGLYDPTGPLAGLSPPAVTSTPAATPAPNIFATESISLSGGSTSASGASAAAGFESPGFGLGSAGTAPTSSGSLGAVGGGIESPGPIALGETAGTGGGTTATTTTTTTSQGAGLGGVFTGNSFGTTGAAGVASSLTSGLVWGAIVGGVAYGVAKLVGLNGDQAMSIGLSAGGGTFAGTTTYFLAQHGTLGATLQGSAALTGIGVGVIVGGTILVMTYKEQRKEIITFECFPWEPPLGGADCELCNADPLRPCSEYRCKSLGQACEIVNAGSANPMCVWVGKGDTSAPVISPWEDILRPADLQYSSQSTTGVVIVNPENPGECLEPWTRLQFGIETDEPAQCRLASELSDTYETMQFPFGSTEYKYNHSIEFKVKNVEFEETESEEGFGAPEIGADGVYTYYSRCRDVNGNTNTAAFSFKFCVDPAPDTTPPTIEGTSITSGSPVASGVDAVPFEIYVDEPAQCRWSRINQAYETMENQFDCPNSFTNINSDLNFVCTTELTGFEDRQDNMFYYACVDSEGNVMRETHEINLRGSEPLIIKAVGPQNTIQGSASQILVKLEAETAFGADNGLAYCGFSTDSTSEVFERMNSTESSEHSQYLYFPAGTHKVYFRCIDPAGNSADAETEFTVEVDQIPPIVTRVYKNGDRLEIRLNEPGKCVYSLESCYYQFSEGASFSSDPRDRTIHTTTWDSESQYFVKCEDLEGNRFAGNLCTIIVQKA